MLRIVLGSYERLLYGLDVTKNNETGSFSVNQTFTYPAHISSIKTVAISPSGKFLATGASDEHVKVYSLHRNKEIGTLFHHTGSITDLEFHETGYLFSASEDNMIAIARTSDWEVLKVLKGHPAPVQSISLHPTGKLLLSVCVDGYLRTWDTAKASCAYTLKLPLARPVKVCWSKCGNYFAVLFELGVVCFSVATGEECWRSTSLGRLCCMDFVELDGKPVLVCAGDSKKVALCSVVDAGNLEPVQISLSSRHPSRIKDLCICVAEFDSKVSVLVTCSSDGAIFGWELARGFSAGDFGDPLFSFDAKVRLTCCKAVFQSGKSAESEEVMETETAVQIQKDDGDDEEGKSSDEKQSSMFKIRQNQKVQISFEDDTKGPEIKNITNSKWQKTKRRVQGKEKILQKMALSKKVAKKPGGDAGAKKFVSKLKKK
ncbi:hypothetical protein HDU82_003111 [Entophlyctis luteolus]|nr:hypothetical protein HDU82_003111 [Entophlyctis luteolus]